MGSNNNEFPLLYPKRSNLSLMENNQLIRFLKLVQGHLVATVAAGSSGNDWNGNHEEEGKTKISDEDLERPFVEYLSKMRLPPKIRSYRLLLPFSSS